MTTFFEDTLDRHELALEKAKQSVDSGLSIAFDVMQKIQFKTPMLAERLIPSGQGKVLLKIDKIKQEVKAALEEIGNKKPEMNNSSITESGNTLIERSSEIFCRIKDLQDYVDSEVDSQSVKSAVLEMNDMKEQLNVGINMAIRNYTYLHERLEIYKKLKKELDTHKKRTMLPPSEHIRQDKQDKNNKIKGKGEFSI